VQKALHDHGAGGGEPLLEPVDGRVAARPDAPRGEVAHAHRDDVLVLRAVEHREHSGPRQLLADPPEEVVRELLLGGSAERHDVHPARVDLADDVLDRAALARRVHALEDQQDAARAARAPLGVELLLQRGDPLRQRGLGVPGVGLLAVEAGRRAGIDGAQVDGARRRPQQIGDLLHSPRLTEGE